MPHATVEVRKNVFSYGRYFFDVKELPDKNGLQNTMFEKLSESLQDDYPELTEEENNSNIAKAMSVLNCLAMYAQYLYGCGNYTKEEKDRMVKICSQFHEKIYEAFKSCDIETLAFEKFQLFA